MMANSNEDVTEAIKILTEHIEHDWRQLGKGLGLSKTDLDGIEHDNQYLPGRIHGLFYLWQRCNGCNATVEQLKKALVDSNLGHMLSYLVALETDNASGPQTKIHVISLLKDPLEDKEKEVHVSDDVPPTKKLKLSKCTTVEQEFEVSAPSTIVSASSGSSNTVSIQDQKPVLKMIHRLKISDWHGVGLQLDLEKYSLEVITRDHAHDHHRQKVEMLSKWLDQDVNATYGKLAKALLAVGEVTCANQLASDIGFELDSTACSASNILSQDRMVISYRNFLINIYSSKLPVGSKWPEMGSNEYINLTMYEKFKLEEAEETKNPGTNASGDLEKFTELKTVEITQVGFDERGIPYEVCIITGAPGVGKSCYVWRLATKWKEGELFKKYVLAIVIRLRDPYVRQAKKLVDLFQHQSERVSRKVAKKVDNSNGEGCLLILDGFDEFPAELRRESIIKQIITGEKLGKASLIITTRSNAAKDLYSICNRRKCQYLEVLGFIQHQIDDYVLSAFKTVISFQKYLQCYPNIRSFMCIPLHCAIVVQIFKSQRSRNEIPKTMTELYTDVVKTLVVRSLQQDYPSFVAEGLDKFMDLPEEYQEWLKQLSKIAYESTLNDKNVFFNTNSKLKILDLLEAEQDLYNPISTTVTYRFLHLTVQEFLAAYYISLLPSNLQLEFLREQFHNSRLAVVIKFVAGLTGFNHLKDSVKSLLITDNTNSLMQCIHCLFEAQDPLFIKTVLESRKIFDLTLFTLSPHDCYALNYCIAVSKTEIDLRLESCKISDDALRMLLQPIQGDANVFFYVKDLVLTKNPAIKARLSKICGALIKNSCLTTLWIEECDIDSNGVKDIKQLLCENKTLKRVILTANCICNEGARYLGAGLMENNSLEYLMLNNCNIGHTGLEAMFEALVHNKTLVELHLDGNPIGRDRVSLLCNKFRGKFSLKKLSLHRCGVNAEDECIKNLKALVEKEDFTLCIDRPIQRLLQGSYGNHDLMMTAVEPDNRNAGCGVLFEDKLFVWGGEMDSKGKVGGCRYLPATESNAFDVWDSKTQMWSHQPTCGDVPELGLGSSLTSYSRWLYLYGGLKEYEENIFADEIYRISMDTFKWEMIPVPPASATIIKPSPRYAMGVILYDHKLCMFGGVGPNILHKQDPGAEWVEAVNRHKGSFGWNNEYYEFDLRNDCWNVRLKEGAYRPKPISSFSFCKFADHKAVLFGGSGSQDDGCSYSNRLYHFDLEHHAWTGPITQSLPWPTGCRFHSLTPLFDPESMTAESVASQWLVLLWGKVSTSTISQDAWMLNLETWTWKKLQLHEGLKPRAWHIACSHYIRRDVVVFGGNRLVDANDYYKGRDAIADLQLISFEQLLQQV